MSSNGFIIFLSGCAVGGAVSYFVTKHRIEKLERAVSEDRIKSLEAYIDEIQEKDQNGDLVDALSYTSNGNEDEDKAKQDYQWVQNGGNKKGVKDPFADVDYVSFYKKKDKKDESSKSAESVASVTAEFDPAASEHPMDDEDEEEFRQKAISYEKSKEAASRTPPKIITAEDYEDPEYDHYDKVTLYYYTDNKVLIDEDDNVIKGPSDDPRMYVGDLIEKSGFDHNEEKALYVRNTSRGTDYEIGKIFGAFEDE